MEIRMIHRKAIHAGFILVAILAQCALAQAQFADFFEVVNGKTVPLNVNGQVGSFYLGPGAVTIQARGRSSSAPSIGCALSLTPNPAFRVISSTGSGFGHPAAISVSATAAGSTTLA